MATTTAQCIDSNPFRKVFDTLVFGYLNRQNYMESARCILNESVELRNITCSSTSTVQLNDVVHGKHLEQIMKMFIERGHFDLQPILLDFGNRLRSLANEFTSFTNADSYWSDAQRTLYGKRVPPNRSNSSESSSHSLNNFIVFPAETQSKTAHSGSYGAASTRRKSAHPIRIDARKKEILKDLVEPVVHSAQQIIDGATSSESNTSQTASSIPIDDTAIGTLERYVANDQLEDLIASLERDMPSTFFDVNNGPSPGNDHFSENDNDGNFTLEPICLPSHHKQEQQQACKNNTLVWSQQPSTQFAVHQTSHLDQSTINHVDAMPTQVPNVDRHISAIDAVQSSFEQPVSVSNSAPSPFIPSKQNSLVDETKLQSVMWTDLSSESPANLELHDCEKVNQGMESSHSKSNEQPESTPKVSENSSQDLASVSNVSTLATIRHRADDAMTQENRIVSDEQLACSSVSNADDEHMPSVRVASNTQDGTNKYEESDESESHNIAPEELHSINEHNAEITIPVNDSLKTPEYLSQSQYSYERLWSSDSASRLISSREHSVANADQRKAFESSHDLVQERPDESIRELHPGEGDEQRVRQKLRDKRWSAEKASFEKWKRKNDEDMMKRREETGKSGESEGRDRELMKGIEKPDDPDLEGGRRKVESRKYKESKHKELAGYSFKSPDPVLKINSNEADSRDFETDKRKGKSKGFEEDESDKSPEDSEMIRVEEQSSSVENVWDKREAGHERSEDQIRRKERKRIESEGKLKEGKVVERRKEHDKYSVSKMEQERKRMKVEKGYRYREKDDRDGSSVGSPTRMESNNEENEVSKEPEEEVRGQSICRKENLEGGKRIKKDVEKRAKEKEKRKKDELELLEKKRMEEEERRKVAEENKRKQIEFERQKEERRRKEVEEEARRREFERQKEEKRRKEVEEEARRRELERQKEEKRRKEVEEEARGRELERQKEEKRRKEVEEEARRREFERQKEEKRRKEVEEEARKREFERQKEEKRRKEVEEEARRREQEEVDRLQRAEEARKVAEEKEAKRKKDEEEEAIRRHREQIAKLDEERRRLEEEFRKRVEKRTKLAVEDSERKKQKPESSGIDEDKRKEKILEANSDDGKIVVERSIEDLFGDSESLAQEQPEDIHGICDQPNSREFVQEVISNKDEEDIADDSADPVLSTNGATYLDKSAYDKADRKDGRSQVKLEERDTNETNKQKDLTVTEKKKKRLGNFTQSDSRLLVDGKERKVGEESQLKSSSKAKSSSQKDRDDRAKESTATDPEKRKKDRGERLRKEQEEIQRQLKEQAEKERKRAVEREKRRREEREGVEREEREKRRRDKEDEREKYRKENESRLETASQSSSAERSPRDKKGRDRERGIKEQEQDRKRLKPSSSSKERQHLSSCSQPDLSYLFDEESNSSDTSSSKRIKQKAKIVSEVSKDNLRRHSGTPTSDSMKSVKESSEKVLKRCAEKRSSSVAKAKAISKSNALLDDLFKTFMAPPSKSGASSHKDPSPPAEVKPKKTVASGVNKNRKNLLIGGGHSARVGMVLEKATRIRARFEHEERLRNEGKGSLNRASSAHDSAQQPSSSSSTLNDHYENRKTVEGYLKSFGGKLGASSSNSQRLDKDSSASTNSRKRILDLPIPKTIALDLVGEILAPKQTQVERYVPTKPTAQQNQLAFSSTSSGNSPSIGGPPVASSSPIASMNSASGDVGDDSSTRINSASYTPQSQSRDLQQSSVAFASTGSASSSSTPATPSSLLQSPQDGQSSSSASTIHNSHSATTAPSCASKNVNVITSSSATSASSSPSSSDLSASATPTSTATTAKKPRLDGNAISNVLNALHNLRR